MRRKSRKFSPMPESRSSSLRNSAIFGTEKYGVMISGRKPLLTATNSMSGSAIRPRTRTEIQTYLEHGSFLYRAQYINEHIKKTGTNIHVSVYVYNDAPQNNAARMKYCSFSRPRTLKYIANKMKAGARFASSPHLLIIICHGQTASKKPAHSAIL